MNPLRHYSFSIEPGNLLHLKLTIYGFGLPKTTNGNARRHWRALQNEAKIWHKHVIAATKNTGITSPLTKAKLKLTRHSSQEPDFDGLVSSFKHVIDGLIKAGIIVNDKMSVIGQPEYVWQKAKVKKGFIEIEIEEAS